MPSTSEVIDLDHGSSRGISPVRKKGKFKLTSFDGDASDPSLLLEKVQLSVKQLGKKKAYQILYFPMTAPLTEAERLSRKVVTSSKIH